MSKPDDSGLLAPAGWSRRTRIVDLVNERGHATIAELASELGVSHMTIRRDIARLSEANEVISFHGGVRPTGAPTTTLAAFSQRETTRTPQKQAIARQAQSLVVRDSVISIDSGSTAAIFARAIPQDVPLSVVTSSLAVIEALVEHDQISLLALGGTLRRAALSFVGARTIANIPDLQVHTHFLAAAALSARGAFDLSDADASVKRGLLEIAERVVLLADSSKFSQIAMSRICDWSSIDVVVTDPDIDAASRDRLAAEGVELIIAN